MYQLSKSITGEINGVIRLSDDAFIAAVPSSSEYQTYLKWVEGYEYQITGHMQQEWVKTSEGNTPEPARDMTPDYRILRQAEYPSIGDQLDALFHAGLMPRELTIQIQAVKAKYPKV
jgi:hypothetical protein